jgi:hypothetical protein
VKLLVFSEKWAAIGPQGFRMSYNNKRHAEIWAKTGKDNFGNDENKLKQDISWDEPESEGNIQEQSADSPGDHISDDGSGTYGDDYEYRSDKPFTKMEAKVMNRLFKVIPMNDIETIAMSNINDIPTNIEKDYFRVIKMYGFESGDIEFGQESLQRFAKWMVDNVLDSAIL